MNNQELATLKMVSALKVAHALHATPNRNYLDFETQQSHSINWYDLHCFIEACDTNWKFSVSQGDQVKKFYNNLTGKELTALELACDVHYVLNYYTGGK